jgi:hypothetical protein
MIWECIGNLEPNYIVYYCTTIVVYFSLFSIFLYYIIQMRVILCLTLHIQSRVEGLDFKENDNCNLVI